jgi:hypothetical protein
MNICEAQAWGTSEGPEFNLSRSWGYTGKATTVTSSSVYGDYMVPAYLWLLAGQLELLNSIKCKFRRVLRMLVKYSQILVKYSQIPK